ncbi:MAG: cystathionine gamma-synthase [Flavobacteriales bacterium]|nr:cystathionine gamma-synthase [Flavobacteriales bacterium]
MEFETKVLHAGIEPDPSTGAIMTPIFQTSTYVQDKVGVHKGYEYARTQNPTRDALQANLAALENGKHGVVFGSGLAATDTLMKLLRPGDEVISTSDLYGGTYRIFNTVWSPYGIKFHFDPLMDADKVRSLVNENTKVIWVETPTNPMMNIIDIALMAEIAQECGAKLIVDNTFASPYLQNPLDQGADIVMHSITKYINGHSDVVMGAVITSDDGIAEELYRLQNSCGAVLGPQDCFLVLRGIKTLHIRMERHCLNGRAVAEFLRKRPEVDQVYWPGFEDHPGHAVAKRQMKDFGGMVSFTLKGNDLEQAKKLAESTQIFALAESLGGVESLIGHPASMTHASIPKAEREKTGVVDSLLRLSVGIEHEKDLLHDLEQAFSK